MVQIMFDRASSESGENECCEDDLFIKSRPASEELSAACFVLVSSEFAKSVVFTKSRKGLLTK